MPVIDELACADPLSEYRERLCVGVRGLQSRALVVELVVNLLESLSDPISNRHRVYVVNVALPPSSHSASH